MNEIAGGPRPTFGVPRLDEQHDRLLHLVNRMREAVKQMRPSPELRRLAADLTLHTRLHFLDEEMFMEGAGYPGLDAHRRRHAEFTEGLLRLQSGLRASRKGNFSRIVEYELAWIHHHLKEEDDELGHWLNERSVFSDRSGPEVDSSSIPIMSS